MRTAIIAAALTLATPLAAAQETTTKSITGDFDADGIEDRVDLVVGEGRYKLTVTPGKAPAEPIVIGYGVEANAGDFLELRKGGTFKTPAGRGGRPSQPLTLSRDLFIYGKSTGEKFIWYWSTASFTSSPYLGDS